MGCIDPTALHELPRVAQGIAAPDECDELSIEIAFGGPAAQDESSGYLIRLASLVNHH
jgi:hypothetical protein